MIVIRKHECMERGNLKTASRRPPGGAGARLYENVPFYRDALDESGVNPGAVTSSWTISAALPFTVKNDLRDNYPFGLFAVPMRGHRAHPRLVGHHRQADRGRLHPERHRGVGRRAWPGPSRRPAARTDDIVQNAYGYGLFTGGLGAHYGAERLGASVIPISGGNTQKQIMLMQDFGTTSSARTPSFALYIARSASEMGIDFDRTSSCGRASSAPSRGPRRCAREIEERLRIKAIDIYGLSEIIGPGVSSECARRRTARTSTRTHFLAEIIDPDTGEPLPDGEVGELVITTMTKEGHAAHPLPHAATSPG